jgi:tRNA-dihydrouridine synthase C
VRVYWDGLEADFAPPHRAGRLKQWLNLLRRRFTGAAAAWDLVREVDDPERLAGLLFGPAAAAGPGPVSRD